MRQTLLAVLLVVATASAADEPKPQWSGLLFKDTVEVLPNRVEKKLPQGPFVGGFVGDAKSFDRFLEVLGKAKAKPDPFWAEWKKSVNWEKEVVAFVVLKAQTNRLTFASCEPGKGSATLAVKWSGIEPFYVEAFPAVFVRVERGDNQRIKFRIDDAELGEVAIKKE